MSSDTGEDNASVVDSSATEWKHVMGNFDDPESPRYKCDEDGYHFRAEKAGHDRVGNSCVNKKEKLYDTRYFIIKSLNHHNIQLSVEKGIWATQVMNEPILEEAVNNSAKVVLIFSVNMSGFFQGYAQMMSSVGWRRDNVWSQGSGKTNPWGRSFKVKWLQLNDLPFQKTLHLKNPLNDFKPVKISRDCQELPYDIGDALCELIDGESDGDKTLRRDDLPLKGPFFESSCSPGDWEHNGHLWAGTAFLYNPFLYPQHATASGFFLAHQGPNGVASPKYFPSRSGLPKVIKSKHSHMSKKVNNLQIPSDVHSRNDICGLSVESPRAITLGDDDFLDMTYEEYLQVHSRSIKQAAGPSQRAEETSRNKKDKDDDYESNSSVASEQSFSLKKARHSFEK